MSTKYQHQLVHVYILIEQVDPSPQVKADLTEIFTVRHCPFSASGLPYVRRVIDVLRVLQSRLRKTAATRYLRR